MKLYFLSKIKNKFYPSYILRIWSLMANSVDPGEAANYESPHMDQCFLQIQLFSSSVLYELKKWNSSMNLPDINSVHIHFIVKWLCDMYYHTFNGISTSDANIYGIAIYHIIHLCIFLYMEFPHMVSYIIQFGGFLCLGLVQPVLQYWLM